MLSVEAVNTNFIVCTGAVTHDLLPHEMQTLYLFHHRCGYNEYLKINVSAEIILSLK
jgi:hypothetical protein